MEDDKATERVQMPLRVDADLIAEIDRRCALVEKTTGRKISRNQWFNNMARWVVEDLPHQAVRSDLIAAWDGMPPEALGIDK